MLNMIESILCNADFGFDMSEVDIDLATSRFDMVDSGLCMTKGWFWVCLE